MDVAKRCAVGIAECRSWRVRADHDDSHDDQSCSILSGVCAFVGPSWKTNARSRQEPEAVNPARQSVQRIPSCGHSSTAFGTAADVCRTPPSAMSLRRARRPSGASIRHNGPGIGCFVAWSLSSSRTSSQRSVFVRRVIAGDVSATCCCTAARSSWPAAVNSRSLMRRSGPRLDATNPRSVSRAAIPVTFDLSQPRCSARSFMAVGSNNRRMNLACGAVQPWAEAIASNASRDSSEAS